MAQMTQQHPKRIFASAGEVDYLNRHDQSPALLFKENAEQNPNYLEYINADLVPRWKTIEKDGLPENLSWIVCTLRCSAVRYHAGLVTRSDNHVTTSELYVPLSEIGKYMIVQHCEEEEKSYEDNQK